MSTSPSSSCSELLFQAARNKSEGSVKRAYERCSRAEGIYCTNGQQYLGEFGVMSAKKERPPYMRR